MRIFLGDACICRGICRCRSWARRMGDWLGSEKGLSAARPRRVLNQGVNKLSLEVNNP